MGLTEASSPIHYHVTVISYSKLSPVSSSPCFPPGPAMIIWSGRNNKLARTTSGGGSMRSPPLIEQKTKASLTETRVLIDVLTCVHPRPRRSDQHRTSPPSHQANDPEHMNHEAGVPGPPQIRAPPSSPRRFPSPHHSPRKALHLSHYFSPTRRTTSTFVFIKSASPFINPATTH